MLLLYTVRVGDVLEFVAETSQKGFDRRLIAFEEMPLANLAVGDQPGTLQRRQMGGYGGLRQSCALVDLPSTDAVFQRMVLLGKMALRFFQPLEDFSPQWMGKGLHDVVEFVGHGFACSVYRD